jgi:hypothetical protein
MPRPDRHHDPTVTVTRVKEIPRLATGTMKRFLAL